MNNMLMYDKGNTYENIKSYYSKLELSLKMSIKVYDLRKNQ